MAFVRLAVAITIFVTSCVGLGYLAASWVRRHGWPGWLSGIMLFAVACFWPVFIIGYVIYTGNRYIAEHPGEVNDAPGMVLYVVMLYSPVIFLVSLLLAFIGSVIAPRGDSNVKLR